MSASQILIIEPSATILEIRGLRVILDFVLARLYEVETRVLKQQVRRNINRFPVDFMFELTEDEINMLVSQFVIPEKRTLGGSKPMAFTEQGVAMLSSVLRSEKALEVNIAIMRTFVHLRRMMEDHENLRTKIDKLEQKYDEQFQVVFTAIRELIQEKNEPRRIIGFRIGQRDETADTGARE